MDARLLFKHYPQIRWVSSFTVYAFKVSTFLQSSVYHNFTEVVFHTLFVASKLLSIIFILLPVDICNCEEKTNNLAY